MAKAMAARKRKMLIEMSGKRKHNCLCDIGDIADLGRVKRRLHKRSLKGLGKVAENCKIFLNKAGTRMVGCYTPKGFRIRGKA